MGLVNVTFGPYTEYGPAQERAIRAERDGILSVNIEKDKDGRWTVRGVQRQTVVVNYKVIGGTAFHESTPPALCALLEAIRLRGTRIVLVYGNVETGERWDSATPERGTLGRSTGDYKVPLLIRTSRSHGGEALLDHCILEVRESKGGRVLYRRVHDNFPVKPLTTQEEFKAATDLKHCMACGRTWDDAIATAYTPAPGARCPFEEFHT